MLLFLFILSLLYLTFHLSISPAYPQYWPDEVLFYSPALEFSKNAILKTSVLDGLIEGMGEHTYWMPPVYMLFNSILLSIFQSSSIDLLRIASLLVSILNSFLSVFISKNLGFTKKGQYLIGALLLTDFLYFKISSTARMESLCFFFTLLSFLFLTIQGSKNLFIAGFFLGISILTHPFGIVHIPIALGLLLYFGRLNWISFIQFSISLGVAISTWFVYIHPNWDLFFLQFGAQLGRKKDLLFSVFTLITKVKIIFSGFKLPILKLILTSIILLFSIKESIPIFKKIVSNKTTLIFEKEKNLLFSLYYTIVVLLFLFLSSESWYVYYLVLPLSMLTISVVESSNTLIKKISSFVLVYNTIVVFLFVYNHMIKYNVRENTELFFSKISNEIKPTDRVYLHIFPDPYFHLKSKYPQLMIREFIPGELPLPEEFAIPTLSSMDVYIFYNTELMHPFLKRYFKENEVDFEKFEVLVPVPEQADYKFFGTIYRRK
jgi:hypothetical protein